MRRPISGVRETFTRKLLADRCDVAAQLGCESFVHNRHRHRLRRIALVEVAARES